MFSSAIVLALGFLGLSRVNALPATSLERRATPLSPSQLSAIVPFAQFAHAAYCPPSKIGRWDCGEPCAALPGFEPTLVGGDGNAVQVYFVGFWPQQNTIIVSHQGTDLLRLQAILTDLNFVKGPLDPSLFPGAPSNIEVHEGFRNEHALTADDILAEVQRLLSSTSATQVTTVGHSLGAALSILEALSLRLRLPSSVPVSARTFGAPRVGDPNFASFFDSKVPNIQRVNNKQDFVPTFFPRFLGFKQPKGEIHILETNYAVACAGDDNDTDPLCTDSKVPTILQGNINDHLGPYQGVYIDPMGCS